MRHEAPRSPTGGCDNPSPPLPGVQILPAGLAEHGAAADYTKLPLLCDVPRLQVLVAEAIEAHGGSGMPRQWSPPPELIVEVRRSGARSAPLGVGGIRPRIAAGLATASVEDMLVSATVPPRTRQASVGLPTSHSACRRRRRRWTVIKATANSNIVDGVKQGVLGVSPKTERRVKVVIHAPVDVRV